MLFDESFWVAVSIIFFVALIFKSIKKSLGAFLASRAFLIENQLRQSIALKKEAEDLLEEHIKLHHNAKQEVEGLLKSAKKEVDHMKEVAEKKMLDAFEAKKVEMLSKIENNEHDFLNQLRLKAVNIAMSVSVATLYENNFEQLNNSIVHKTLNSIKKIV